MSPSTFVLVHGAGANAASWTPTARELTLRGHRAVALDLPGHGAGARIPRGYLGHQDAGLLATEPSGMGGRSSADERDAVVDAVRRAAGHGPVVLVGHSRGGLAVTAAANAVPDLLAHVVYVAAWCPVAASVADYHASAENHSGVFAALAGALVLADPAALGAIRMNWRTDDPAALALAQEALLADGDRDELLAALHAMDPDEALAVDDDVVRVDPARWGPLRRTYVRLTEDRAMPVALQDRFVAEADAACPGHPFATVALRSSHLGALVRPAVLADVLAEVATAT